jgi:hypothetical protein
MGYRTSVDHSLFEDAEKERFGIVARGRLAALWAFDVGLSRIDLANPTQGRLRSHP